MSHHQPLEPSDAFAELGRIKLADTDIDSILDKIAELAQRTIPGADEVSVTLIRGKGARTPPPSPATSPWRATNDSTNAVTAHAWTRQPPPRPYSSTT